MDTVDTANTDSHNLTCYSKLLDLLLSLFIPSLLDSGYPPAPKMAGAKRKSVADTKPTRRVSRRVEKAEVNYAESDAEGPASDSEFNEDVEESEHGEESEPEEEKEQSEEYDSDDSEAANKKDGWTKKGGKWQMVISLPKEKDDGGIPYEDDRIHPNTLDFLKALKKNNKREWLKHHDRPFRSALLPLFLND